MLPHERKEGCSVDQMGILVWRRFNLQNRRLETAAYFFGGLGMVSAVSQMSAVPIKACLPTARTSCADDDRLVRLLSINEA